MGFLRFASFAVVCVAVAVVLFKNYATRKDGWVLDPKWVAGKEVIVTGANTGLGYEAALQLAQAGASVTLGCRTMTKCEAAAAAIREAGGTHATAMHLDLGDLDSVAQFADAYIASHDRLDLLINNAGIMMVQYQKSKQGFESQFAVNHLGHFALTGRLLGLLKKSKSARVINHSSSMSDFAKTLELEQYSTVEQDDYSPVDSYAVSKRANRYFTWSLNRKLQSQGSTVRSMACDPGWVASQLQMHANGVPIFVMFAKVANPLLSQSVATGVWPLLQAAADPALAGGEVTAPRFAMWGPPVVKTTQECDLGQGDHCTSDHLERLWASSVEATGIDYGL